MMTRRELIDRVTSRMRARGGDGRVEASLCFLRAILAGVGDDAPVPNEALARVQEFLRIDDEGDELLDSEPPPPAPARRSGRISTAPPMRMTRILFLGRNDAVRLPMLDAVATARFAGIAEVRSAAIAPVTADARVIKVLRHAGIETEHLAARTVSVDDLSWADLVITVSGSREDWERFIPRSMSHDHHPIPDPELDAIPVDADPLDALRYTLRMVERVIGQVRPARPSRFPPPAALPPSDGRLRAANPLRPSSARLPALARIDTEKDRS